MQQIGKRNAFELNNKSGEIEDDEIPRRQITTSIDVNNVKSIKVKQLKNSITIQSEQLRSQDADSDSGEE